MPSKAVYEDTKVKGRWCGRVTYDALRVATVVKGKLRLPGWRETESKYFGKGSKTQNRADADEWASDELKKAKKRGKASSDVTVAEFGAQYMDRVRRTLKPASVRLKEYLWKNYLLPLFGAFAMRTLKASDIGAIYLQLSQRAPGVAKGVHHLLAGILDDAMDDDIIEANPARRATKNLLKKPRDPDEAPNALDYRDASTLLAYAREYGTPQEYAFACTLFDTGARVSEAGAWCWSDLDVAARKLTIRRQLAEPCHKKPGGGVTDPTFGTLKDSGRSRASAPLKRVVRLSQATVDAIVAHGAAQRELVFSNQSSWFRAAEYLRDRADADDKMGHFLFSKQMEDLGTRDTVLGTPLTQHVVARILKRLCEGAGVRVISPHGCRHSCASIMLAGGEPLNRVAKHLGDKEATVSQYYSHAMESDMESAAEKRGALLHRA